MSLTVPFTSVLRFVSRIAYSLQDPGGRDSGNFRSKISRQGLRIFPMLILLSIPAVALAQSGSPFDTGFTNLQNLFTGTIAKVASLIAIVIGGYQFAHGEPGSRRLLAGVAAGTGIAVLAANILSWLWGI